MNKLLARDAGFTAVFCMSDIMAVGAMRALTDAGLRVPQDISVLGFDGIELGQYAVPRLATVSQPQQEIADQSAKLAFMLARKLIRKELKPEDHTALIRESLEQFPSEN